MHARLLIFHVTKANCFYSKQTVPTRFTAYHMYDEHFYFNNKMFKHVFYTSTQRNFDLHLYRVTELKN